MVQIELVGFRWDKIRSVRDAGDLHEERGDSVVDVLMVDPAQVRLLNRLLGFKWFSEEHGRRRLPLLGAHDVRAGWPTSG